MSYSIPLARISNPCPWLLEYFTLIFDKLRAIDSQLNCLRSNRIYDDGTGNAAVLPNGNWCPSDKWRVASLK